MTDNTQELSQTAVELQQVMDGYSPAKQTIIARLASGANVIAEQKRLLIEDKGYNVAAGQQPTVQIFLCEDSRATKEQLGIKFMGTALVDRKPGACASINGEITPSARTSLQLGAKYGVEAVYLSQHEGCGYMAIVRDYHLKRGIEYHGEKDFATWLDKNMPDFAVEAKAQKGLVDRVMANGTEHYQEKMGMPLVGTDDDKIQQMLAIQQAADDQPVVEAYCQMMTEQTGMKFPEVLAGYQPYTTDNPYVFSPENGKFRCVPLTDDNIQVSNPKGILGAAKAYGRKLIGRVTSSLTNHRPTSGPKVGGCSCGCHK